MPRIKRPPWGRLLAAACALIVAILAWGPSAGAQTGTTPASLPPTVSFVDDTPLEVKFDPAKPTFTIDVRNDAPDDQLITVKPIAFPEEGVAVAPTDGRSLTVPNGTSASFTFSVTVGDPEVVKSYPGTIIAGGESGALARKTVTIVVSDPAAAADEDAEDGRQAAGAPAISADQVGDVTIGATNYLPSLLSHLAYLAIAAAGLLLVLLWVYWGRWGGKAHVLAVLGCSFLALLFVGVYELSGGELPDKTATHAISSRSIPVSGETAPNPVGVATNTTGDLVQLQVIKRNKDLDELRATDLEFAGEFKGDFDLSTVKEKGEAKATVNVRDFWLWAVLPIALGVWLAYALQRWLKLVWPARRLRLEAERIVARMSAADAEFLDVAEGRPYGHYLIAERVSERLKKIFRLIDEPDFEKAREELTKLDDYVTSFLAFRGQLGSLDDAVERLKQLRRKTGGFGLERDGEVSAIRSSLALMTQGFDSKEPDDDGELLKEARDEAKKQLGLVDAVTTKLADVSVRIEAADAELAKLPRTSPKRKPLNDLITSQQGLGKRIQLAESLEDLKGMKPEEQKATAKLVENQGATDVTPDIAPEVYEAASRDEPRMTHMLARAVSEEHERTPDTKISLTYSVLQATGFVEGGAVHTGDTVKITARIEGEGPHSFTTVRFELGDGRRILRAVPPGDPAEVELVTSFKQGGRKEVGLTIPDSPKSIEPLRIEVDPEPRLRFEQQMLARDETQMRRVALALAVASGIFALYANDPSWGVPQDYLAALLWGGGTTAALGLAISLSDFLGVSEK